MYVQYTGVRNFLLRLPGRERHRLHPDQFEKIQHTIGKNETEVAHVELRLCRVLIHDYKGTSFHGIYLSNLQKISCIILRNLFGLYLISHVPPAHSFFEKRTILEGILLI